MGVRLTVKMKSGAKAGTTKTVVLDDDVITFGRDQGCQVVLAQQAVSRNHARISKDGTLFFLEDLGSSYGTQVNGQALPKGEKRLLRNGDTIAIAQFDVVFDRIADVGNGQSEKTSFLSRSLVKDAMKGLASNTEHAYFRVMNGPTEGTRIEILDAQEYIFGRDGAEADVVLNDDLVSRKHVKVRRDWSGTHIEDLGSRNGIKVNKKRTRKETLKDRDEVEIGGVRLLFVDPSEAREDPVVLSTSGEDEPEEEGESTQATNERDEPEEEAPEEPSEQSQTEQEASSEPDQAEEAGASEQNETEAADENQGEEEPPPEESDAAPEPASRNPLALIDFNNKQHLIVLGIGALMVILGIVLIILLVAGA